MIIKISVENPVRVGIKYLYDYQAVKAYEQLFNQDSGINFKLLIELLPGKIMLTLISELNGQRIQYKDLSYKVSDLQKLQYLPAGSPMQFVHVYPKSNNLFIAKAFRKNLFINITGHEIISPESYGM
jgi:hypothetical protein